MQGIFLKNLDNLFKIKFGEQNSNSIYEKVVSNPYLIVLKQKKKGGREAL